MNSMYRVIARFVLIIWAICESGQAQTIQTINHSADYFRAMQNQYLNRSVTINVTHVLPGQSAIEGRIDGYRSFAAFTEDGDSSGIIDVAVPTLAVEFFVNKYGTSLEYYPVNDNGELFPKTKPLTGTLLKYESDMVYGGGVLYILCPNVLDSMQDQSTPNQPDGGKVIKYTADYYRAFQDHYINQTVTVYVSKLDTLLNDSPIKDEDIPPGHQYLIATTYNDGLLGGSIHVAIPIMGIKKAIAKYGDEPRWNPAYGSDNKESPHKTQPLSGTLLRNKQGRPYILYSE